MTVGFIRQGGTAASLDVPVHSSSLVRRLLLQSQEDPAKLRVLTLLLEVDDVRLLSFGLTREDIAILRATGRGRKD